MSHKVLGIGKSNIELQPNESYQPPELYEQLEMEQRPVELNKRYGRSNKNGVKTAPIVLAVTLLLCLLVVSLVAVILYSPQVRTSSKSAASANVEALTSRIQQLEARQTGNQTQLAPTTAQESSLTSQFQNVQNLVQSMSLVQSNNALTLNQLREDFQDNLLLDTLHNLTVLQGRVDQLSTLTTQITSVQNLIQSITLVQTNLRDDLDRLRSVDLYQGCISDTRSCLMTTGGNSGYYWRSCNTNDLYISPTVSVPYL